MVTGSWTHNHDVPVSLLSTSQQTALPLPKSVKGNRSFANLAKLFGIGSGYVDEGEQEVEVEEEEEEEEEEADAIDEDSLMWDAQTALIAHQPAIAMQHYETAALPPHRSAGACLALGNLLTRGSSLLNSDVITTEPTSSETTPRARKRTESGDTVTTKTATARIRDYIFRSPPISPSSTLDSPKQPARRITVGWGIPREGNKAVRDVEGMGVAGGWLVLGLGWLVEEEMARGRLKPQAASPDDTSHLCPDGDDDALLIKRRRHTATRHSSRRNSVSDQQSSVGMSNDSSDRTESSMVKTPHEDDRFYPSQSIHTDVRTEYDLLKLFYDLMCPLVSLYRHGQIQAHDPTHLPPISFSQLPACLRPQGDHQKRRNAWHLGGVVMQAIKQLEMLRSGSLANGKGKGKEVRKVEQRRIGVAVIANYLLGMTRSDAESEAFFRQVVHLGQTGLDVADDLVRQAATRLDIILRSPPSSAPMSPQSEYPFPTIGSTTKAHPALPSTVKSRQHRRVPSTASTYSIMSTLSARLVPSTKSSASIAAMAIDTQHVSAQYTASRATYEPSATSTLRRVRASSTKAAEVHSQAWWPSIPSWISSSSTLEDDSIVEEDSETSEVPPSSRRDRASTSAGPPSLTEAFQPSPPRKANKPSPSPPLIQTIASTPGVDPSPQTMISKTRRRLPFEPSETDSISTIDPELAAAELRSALTKHVVCGICGVKGLNFPECPRCGLTFCSRECRVDEKKAGNGKRHVCGVWESRRFLTVPSPASRPRRRSNSILVPPTIKA